MNFSCSIFFYFLGCLLDIILVVKALLDNLLGFDPPPHQTYNGPPLTENLTACFPCLLQESGTQSETDRNSEEESLSSQHCPQCFVVFFFSK